MMRFRASRENLTLWPDPAQRGECTANLVRLLVPRHTKRVYVAWLAPGPPPEPIEGMSLVPEGGEPSNFLASFRVLTYPDEVIVVAAEGSNFTRSAWRTLAAELDPTA